MPPTFLQPKSFINAVNSATSFNYSYEQASNQRCLYESCSVMDSNTTYNSSMFRDATPPTRGCWFPVVSSQSDLDENHTTVVNSSTGFLGFLFFKTGGSTVDLYHASELTNGFEDCTLVPVEDKPSDRITTENFGSAKIQLQNADGPVIIVGILDIGDPGDGR
jgi:hypothetical protein